MDEDPQLNLRLAMMLEQSNVIEQNPVLEVDPSIEQLEMTDGSFAVIASTHGVIDDEFAIARILDPGAYSDLYPDYEERSEKYALCHWHSQSDPQGDVGWIQRIRLVPLDFHQYEELETMMLDEGLPVEPPEWLHEVYEKFTERMAETTPYHAKPVRCGMCGDKKVELHGVKAQRVAFSVGEIQIDEGGETSFVPMNGVEGDTEVMAHLHCTSCGGRQEFEPQDMDRIRMHRNDG